MNEAVRAGRALEVATTALAKIDQHLESYAEDQRDQREERRELKAEMVRMRELVNKSLTRVHGRLDHMIGRWFTAAISVIAALIAMVGYLLTSGVPWQ